MAVKSAGHEVPRCTLSEVWYWELVDCGRWKLSFDSDVRIPAGRDGTIRGTWL